MIEQFYYNDPNAPKPNVAVSPGVSAILFDECQRILFMKRTQGDWWCLPGGRMDSGESAQDCCVREMAEETGLHTEIVRLIAVNTSPLSVCSYPDGNVHQSFVLCFEVRQVGGHLQESSESAGFRWLSPGEIDSIRLIPDSRLNALDAWANSSQVFLR